MKKNRLKLPLYVAATLLFSYNVAFAADDIVLKEISGEAMINKGEKYDVASEGMIVMPGDMLMVTEGSVAKLVYPNECVVEVTGEYVLSVKEEAPCAAGLLLATVGGSTVSTAAVAGGLAGAIALGAALGSDSDDDGFVSGSGSPAPTPVPPPASSGRPQSPPPISQ